MPRRGKKSLGGEECILASQLMGLIDISRVYYFACGMVGGQGGGGGEGGQTLRGKAAVSKEVAVLCNHTDRVRHNV